jgi:hypothetical protein
VAAWVENLRLPATRFQPFVADLRRHGDGETGSITCGPKQVAISIAGSGRAAGPADLWCCCTWLETPTFRPQQPRRSVRFSGPGSNPAVRVLAECALLRKTYLQLKKQEKGTQCALYEVSMHALWKINVPNAPCRNNVL